MDRLGPLHYAAANCSNDTVRTLAKAYPEALKKLSDECFVAGLPLHYAAAYSTRVEVVRLLLELYPGAVRTRSGRGLLPLHEAASKNSSVEIVHLLMAACPEALQAMVTVDIKGLPLHFAAALNPHIEVVRTLIQAYPEALHTPTCNSQLPLHHAAAHNSCPDVVRLLIQKYPKALQMMSTNTVNGLPLHSAASFSRHVKVVRAVLESYPDAIHTKNDRGLLPLHAAAKHNSNVEVLKLLIDAYPDALHAMSIEGLPLHYACAHLYVEMVRVLLEANPIAIRSFCDKGLLPLHYARTVEVAQLLVRAYPEALQQPSMDSRRCLPFHQAIIHGYRCNVVRALLQSYPGAIDKEIDGKHVFHYSAASGFVDNLEVLLEFGVCIDMQDKQGWTALHHSARGGHVKAVTLLLSRGANRDVKNSSGRTAEDLACEKAVCASFRRVCTYVVLFRIQKQ